MRSSHVTKILTCCYCSARSTLPPGKAAALVCHSCGAPVRQIEKIQAEIERLPRQTERKRPAIAHPAEITGEHREHNRPDRRRKGKYRKYTHDKDDRKRRGRGFWYYVKKLGDEAEDLLEDIFD